jgi:hypothetical protein
MLTATILSTLLVLQPLASPLTSTDAADPNRVDVEHTDTSIHVLAYDADGEVSAEIVEWRDSAGLRIDANFPDGVYLSATVRGEDDITIESNDPAVVSERITAVEDVLARSTTGANKWTCALEVLASAAACGAASGPVGAGACAVTALLVACACIPLIAKDVPDDAECFE